MFNNLTYKQKFIGIILILCLLLLSVYKKTYKSIFLSNKEINNLSGQLQDAEMLGYQMIQLKNEVNLLDEVIGGQTDNPEKVQQEILDYISKSNFQVDIVNIEDTHKLTDNEFVIYTNQVELEGNYDQLVKFLFALENEFGLSRVANIELVSIKDYRRNIKKLHLKILFQNYEKTK